MEKILEIEFEKISFEIETSINSNASNASICVAFKDICIELRSTKDQFDNSISNGYCTVVVHNEDFLNYEIEQLSTEQIVERMTFYNNNLISNKEFLQRSPLYRNIGKSHLELDNIVKNIALSMSKQQILSKYGREIEFYNNQLFYNFFTSNRVEIHQEGFSFDEFKVIMKSLYLHIIGTRRLIYDIDFSTLTFR